MATPIVEDHITSPPQSAHHSPPVSARDIRARPGDSGLPHPPLAPVPVEARRSGHAAAAGTANNNTLTTSQQSVVGIDGSFHYRAGTGFTGMPASIDESISGEQYLQTSSSDAIQQARATYHARGAAALATLDFDGAPTSDPLPNDVAPSRAEGRSKRIPQRFWNEYAAPPAVPRYDDPDDVAYARHTLQHVTTIVDRLVLDTMPHSDPNEALCDALLLWHFNRFIARLRVVPPTTFRPTSQAGAASPVRAPRRKDASSPPPAGATRDGIGDNGAALVANLVAAWDALPTESMASLRQAPTTLKDKMIACAAAASNVRPLCESGCSLPRFFRDSLWSTWDTSGLWLLLAAVVAIVAVSNGAILAAASEDLRQSALKLIGVAIAISVLPATFVAFCAMTLVSARTTHDVHTADAISDSDFDCELDRILALLSNPPRAHAPAPSARGNDDDADHDVQPPPEWSASPLRSRANIFIPLDLSAPAADQREPLRPVGVSVGLESLEKSTTLIVVERMSLRVVWWSRHAAAAAGVTTTPTLSSLLAPDETTHKLKQYVADVCSSAETGSRDGAQFELTFRQGTSEEQRVVVHAFPAALASAEGAHRPVVLLLGSSAEVDRAGPATEMESDFNRVVARHLAETAVSEDASGPGALTRQQYRSRHVREFLCTRVLATDVGRRTRAVTTFVDFRVFVTADFTHQLRQVCTSASASVSVDVDSRIPREAYMDPVAVDGAMQIARMAANAPGMASATIDSADGWQPERRGAARVVALRVRFFPLSVDYRNAVLAHTAAQTMGTRGTGVVGPGPRSSANGEELVVFLFATDGKPPVVQPKTDAPHFPTRTVSVVERPGVRSPEAEPTDDAGFEMPIRVLIATPSTEEQRTLSGKLVRLTSEVDIRYAQDAAAYDSFLESNTWQPMLVIVCDDTSFGIPHTLREKALASPHFGRTVVVVHIDASGRIGHDNLSEVRSASRGRMTPFNPDSLLYHSDLREYDDDCYALVPPEVLEHDGFDGRIASDVTVLRRCWRISSPVSLRRLREAVRVAQDIELHRLACAKRDKENLDLIERLARHVTLGRLSSVAVDVPVPNAPYLCHQDVPGGVHLKTCPLHRLVGDHFNDDEDGSRGGPTALRVLRSKTVRELRAFYALQQVPQVARLLFLWYHRDEDAVTVATPSSIAAPQVFGPPCPVALPGCDIALLDREAAWISSFASAVCQAVLGLAGMHAAGFVHNEINDNTVRLAPAFPGADVMAVQLCGLSSACHVSDPGLTCTASDDVFALGCFVLCVSEPELSPEIHARLRRMPSTLPHAERAALLDDLSSLFEEQLGTTDLRSALREFSLTCLGAAENGVMAPQLLSCDLFTLSGCAPVAPKAAAGEQYDVPTQPDDAAAAGAAAASPGYSRPEEEPPMTERTSLRADHQVPPVTPHAAPPGEQPAAAAFSDASSAPAVVNATPQHVEVVQHVDASPPHSSSGSDDGTTTSQKPWFSAVVATAVPGQHVVAPPARSDPCSSDDDNASWSGSMEQSPAQAPLDA